MGSKKTSSSERYNKTASLTRNETSENFESELLLTTVDTTESSDLDISENSPSKKSSGKLRSYSGPLIQLPESLTDTLVEFTMNLLLERPSDPLDYGRNYFKRIKESKHTPIEYVKSLMMAKEEEMERQTAIKSKRKCVYAEPLDMSSSVDYVKPYYPKTPKQMEMLLEVSKKILLFRSLDEEQLEDILNALFEAKVSKGKVIITQGDEGDYFYLIEKGIFNVYKSFDDGPPLHVHTYQNEGFFGELALMYNQPRAATVIAETDGVIWVLDRNTFRHLVLKSAFQKRKRYEEFVESIPLFENLETYEKMNVADALVPKKYKHGEVIVEKGALSQGIYFVETGAVSTIHDENQGEIDVSKIESKGYFGEKELVSEQPFKETLIAEGDTKLAFLDMNTFENVLGICYKSLSKAALG